MCRPYGSDTIVPYEYYEISPSVFVRANPLLVIEVGVFIRTGEHKIGIGQRFTDSDKIWVHLGMTVENMPHCRVWKLDSPIPVVDTVFRELQRNSLVARSLPLSISSV